MASGLSLVGDGAEKPFIVAFSRLELGDNIVAFCNNTSNQAVEMCCIYASILYVCGFKDSKDSKCLLSCALSG